MSSILMVLILLAGQAARPETTTAKRDRLTTSIADLCATGKHAEALKSAEQLAALDKRDGRAAFGYAGLLARAGRADEALKQLDRAIKLHAVYPLLLEHDPDFETIRNDTRFGKLAQAAAADARQEQEKSKTVWTVTLPATYEKWHPARLIVALHGHGGRAEDMRRLWSKLAEEHGAILLTPEGRFEGPGGGKSWGWSGTPAREILAAINDTKRRLRIEHNSTVLTGFSQGGGMTYALGLAYPRSFRALIPMAAPFTYHEDPHFKDGSLKDLRVFIVVGGDDQNAPLNKQAAPLFEEAGCRVKLNVFPGVGHALPPHHEQVLRDALKFAFDQ